MRLMQGSKTAYCQSGACIFLHHTCASHRGWMGHLLQAKAVACSPCPAVPDCPVSGTDDDSLPEMAGVTEADLSLYRGAGAISGLMSTVIFPSLISKTGALLYCDALLLSLYFCARAGLLFTALVLLASAVAVLVWSFTCQLTSSPCGCKGAPCEITAVWQ